MDTPSTSSSGGIGFTGLLAVALIVLKLAHVIAWSWWWVLAPVWLVGLLGLAVLAILTFIMALGRTR